MDTEDGKMEEDEVPNQGARGSHSRKPQSRSFSFNLDSLKSRKTNWSPDEESTLARLHRDVGNRWSMIAKHLPGRSDNDVKNMWHSTLRAKSCRRGSFLFTYVRAVSDCCDDHEARRAAYDKAKALCSGSHPASPLMASGPAGPAHRISAPGIASTGQSPQLSHRQQQLLQQQQQQTYQAASPGAASVEGPDSTGSLQSGPGSTGPGLQPGYPSGLLLHPQPQHQPPSPLGPHSNNSQGPSSSMQLRGPGPSSTGRTSLGAPSAFAGALDHGFGDASGALQLGRAPSGQPGGLLGNTAPPSPSPPPSRRSDFGSSELGGSVASEGSCLARLSSLHLAAGSGQGPAEIRTLGGMTLAGPAGLALPGLPLIGRHPVDRGRGRAGSRSWGPGAAGRSRGVSPRSAGARSMDVHGEDGMDLSLKELFKLPAGAEAGAAGVEAPQLATFGDNPLWHVGEQNQGQSDTHTEQQLQLQQMLLRGGAGAAGGGERSGHGAPRRQTRSMPQHPFFAGVEGSPQGGAGGSSLVLQPFGAEREQRGRQEEDAPAPFRPYVGQQLMGQQQQRLLRPPHMEGMPYVTLADAADPGEGPGDPGSLLDMDAVPGNAGRRLSSLQHVVRQQQQQQQQQLSLPSGLRRGPASGSVSGPHRGRLVQFEEHMEGPASGLGLDPGPSSHGGHAAMTLHRFSGPGNEALRSGAMDHPLSLRANSEFREDGGPGGGMGGGGWLGHEGALGPGQLRVPSGVASRSSFSSAILEDWAAFAAHGGSGVPSEHVASFRGSETTGSSRLASGSSRHTAGKQKLMAELGYQSFASHGSFGGASGLGLASGASVSGASGSASGGGSGAGSFIAGYQAQGQVGAAQLGRSRFSPFYDDAMRLGPKLPGQSRSGPMMRVVDAEGGEQDTELPGPAPAPLSFGDMLPGQQQQHDEQLSLQQQQQQYQNHYQQQPTLHQQHHQYHQQQQQQQHLGGSEGPLFAASAGNSGAMPSSSSHSLHRLDMQHLALALNSNSGRLPHSGGSAALSPGGLAVGAAPLASLAPGLLRPAPVVEGIVTMGLEDEDLYECLGELHEGRGGGGV